VRGNQESSRRREPPNWTEPKPNLSSEGGPCLVSFSSFSRAIGLEEVELLGAVREAGKSDGRGGGPCAWASRWLAEEIEARRQKMSLSRPHGILEVLERVWVSKPRVANGGA